MTLAQYIKDRLTPGLKTGKVKPGVSNRMVYIALQRVVSVLSLCARKWRDAEKRPWLESVSMICMLKTTKVQTLTVQDLAKAWLLDGNAELQRRFNKDLFPVLGNTAVNNVSEHNVRALIRTVVNRGAHRQAISFFADLIQRFRWARKRQPWRTLLVEGYPTELVDITALIPADYEAERSRILSPAELLELHNLPCCPQPTSTHRPSR